MYRQISISLMLLVVLVMAGCNNLKPITAFECTLDSGAFWHDVKLTNKSGKVLHEVKFKLTLIGENSEPRSEERYFARWNDGEVKTVSLKTANSPRNVQKLSLEGSSSEGSLSKTWVTQ